MRWCCPIRWYYRNEGWCRQFGALPIKDVLRFLKLVTWCFWQQSAEVMMVQQKDDCQSHRCSMAMLNPVSQPGTCGWRCCCCCTVPSVLPLSAALLLYCCNLWLYTLHTVMQCATQLCKPNTFVQLFTLALQSIKTLHCNQVNCMLVIVNWLLCSAAVWCYVG